MRKLLICVFLLIFVTQIQAQDRPPAGKFNVNVILYSKVSGDSLLIANDTTRTYFAWPYQTIYYYFTDVSTVSATLYYEINVRGTWLPIDSLSVTSTQTTFKAWDPYENLTATHVHDVFRLRLSSTADTLRVVRNGFAPNRGY